MIRTKMNVFKQEKYMNDATVATQLQFLQAVKRKKHSIWSVDDDDVYNALIQGTTLDSFSKQVQSTGIEVDNNLTVDLGKSVLSKPKSEVKHTKKNNYPNRTPWHSMTYLEVQKEQNIAEVNEQKIAKVSEQKTAEVSKQTDAEVSKTEDELVERKFLSRDKQNKNAYAAATLKESDKMYTYTGPSCNSVQNGFQERGSRKKEDHKNSPQKLQQLYKKKSSSMTMGLQNLSKPNDAENMCLNLMNIPKKTKKKLIEKENVCSSQIAIKTQSDQKKRVSRAERYSSKDSSSMMNNTANQLIIKVMCNDACQEIMTDHPSFLQRRRIFPKFSEVIPDVDCGKKEVNTSFEALKVILEFLFSACYSFNKVASVKVGIEILAAAQCWEIAELQKKFQEYFLEKFLSENNLNDMYAIAAQLGVTEICEACKNYSENGNSLDATSVQYEPRKCCIEISTYREASEFSIPLDPVTKEFTDVFNKSIDNDITFEAISGCFIITGIQIKLDVNTDNESNSSMLKIFYSAENITEGLSIEEQTSHKPLRRTIIIYFKEPLVIKPRQKGRISIYTDIKPCLCFTFQKGTIREKLSKGEFQLTLESNFKVQNTNRKRFFIGKFFYHEKPTSFN